MSTAHDRQSAAPDEFQPADTPDGGPQGTAAHAVRPEVVTVIAIVVVCLVVAFLFVVGRPG